MNVVIQLLNNKEVSQQVKKKILQLIQHWGIRFEDDSDVLPLFTNVYSALKAKKLPFADEDEAKKQVRQLKDALDGKAAMPDSKPLDKKHQKLRKDLEIVMENVVLANEMIDAHDLDDEVDSNDALISLIQAINTFENKIMELIGKIKNDQVMHLALTTNDDMQRTVKRFKKLEHGRAPEKFKPECRKFLPSYKGTPEKAKAASKPSRTRVEAPKFVQQEKVSRPPQSSDDIFGDEPVGSSAPSRAPAPQKASSDDIFGLDFNEPAPTSSAAPTQNSNGSNVSLLTDIMGKMTLNKQQEMNQFNTAMPGGGPGIGQPPMGSPGMGGPGMGGPGMGQPPMGQNPGMFNTGMPPQNMGGNNFGQPNNFNTGYPGGGMGGQGNMNQGFGGGGFNQQNPGYGGGGFGGASNDPFANNNTGLFNTAAPSGFNPGGGPDAFKHNKPKPKKEGPKEFNALFGMADKISDRKGQPKNSVEDYVTTYKNNYNEPGGYDNFGVDPNSQNPPDVNDFFGGGGEAPQQDYNGGFDNQQPQQNDAFGYSQPQENQPNNLDDDFFGGGGGNTDQSNDIYGGLGDSNQPDNSADMGGDIFGNDAPQPQDNYNNYGGGGGGDQYDDPYNQPAEQQNYDQNDNYNQQDYNQQQNYNQPPAQQQPEQNQSSNQDELFDIFG